MDAEAKRIKEQNKNLPFKERMSNNWHYYKIHFFAILIIVALVAITVVQCTTQIKYDLSVSMYCAEPVPDEHTSEITEILKEQCKDINDDDAINVLVNVYVADIEEEQMNQMSYAVLQKVMLDFSANTVAAFIVDETYKTFLVENYEYPIEDVVEISSIPEIRERLKLSEGEKLYWLPMPNQKDSDDEPDQFDNAALVDKYFKNK